MVTHGLLVRFEAHLGREEELEEFLRSAQDLVRMEPDTTAWFAFRFGRYEYGIFDAFPSEAGRRAHLAGPVASALGGVRETLLTGEPLIEPLAILASKLPTSPSAAIGIGRGLLLTFRAKQGHELQVAQFLRDARGLVEEEPGTVAWFALQRDSGDYGIFDVFPDNAARFAHLTGQVPRELTKHALSLLGGLPDIDMLKVVAACFSQQAAPAAA